MDLGDKNKPVGVYYRRLAGTTWTAPKNIYTSNYFRSSPTEDGNINIVESDFDGLVNIYVAWGDPAQKKIFLAKSLDAGELWEGAFQVRGPEDFSVRKSRLILILVLSTIRFF